MSSTDDPRPPRRPQPDRDSFYDKHAQAHPGVVTGSAAAPVTGSAAAHSEPAEPETIVIDDGAESLPTTEFSTPSDDASVLDTSSLDAAGPDTGAVDTPSTRTDLRTESDVVVTEPFVDVDDATPDADGDAPRRRLSEHFSEEPLPYVEPSPTAPLAYDDQLAPSELAPAYSEVPPAPLATESVAPAADAPVGRGTLDLGLLILRVVVGVIFLLHGLQKLTTWSFVNGMGIDGFAGFLANNGDGQDASLGFNPDVTDTLSLLGGITETVAGILLILGLLTPIAGAAALGVMIVAITYLTTLAGGLSFFASAGGFEFEYLLAAAAVAIILCGAGGYSADRRWGWSRRPAWGSAAWLIIAVAAAIAIWIVFNGANPLHGH